MKTAGIIGILMLSGWWLTADQQGQSLMRQKDYTQAAETFEDPMWQGIAWYRAGEFEQAIMAFGRVSSAEASYNAGNAWLLLGKYDQAVASYDKALEQRPGWIEAEQNRNLAVAGKRVDSQGGEMGDQQIGADEVVFDKSKKSDGEETQVAGEKLTSDAAIQAIWLRQVQTKPADFLKAKFAYQLSQDPSGEQP